MPRLSVRSGSYEITKNEDDRMVFKTAPLRNVALTAPYFHDGKIKTLPKAVRIMGKLQLDVELTEQQVQGIMRFLQGVVGYIQGNTLSKANKSEQTTKNELTWKSTGAIDRD